MFPLDLCTRLAPPMAATEAIATAKRREQPQEFFEASALCWHALFTGMGKTADRAVAEVKPTNVRWLSIFS